jgi:glyoxylase I family protein
VVATWEKISHISFSARDKEACADWLERVLDFQRFDATQGDGWSAILLIHPPSASIVEFQQHDRNGGEPFDPARTGFDHMGFKVSSRDELEKWQARLADLGVDHTPIADREYGSVLTFRDPDGRQFEMFYRDGHP